MTGKIMTSSDRNRYREKAKLIYEKCPDRDNWDCVMAFVDKHINENPVIIEDFLEFLKEEIIILEKEKNTSQLNQSKILMKLIEKKLKS